MGYLHDTPGHRLLRFLMNRGGHATLSEIARRANDGRLYARAKPELDGLIIEQRCGSPRTTRSVTRVFLTMKGWGACATLRPGWTPKRLSTDVLKSWLLELQDERDPWALRFVKDAQDAAELKHLRAIGHIRPPLKRRGPPKGIQPKGGFQRQIDPIPVGAKVIPPSRPAEVHDHFNRRIRGDFQDFKTPLPRRSQPALWTPPAPTLEQMEARRLEAERLKRDCPICQAGVDPSFVDHDPVTHKAYL
jgi:hypothetical protein